jgi:chromosome segregation ATPase
MRRDTDRVLAVLLALAVAAAVVLCFARVGRIRAMEAERTELTRQLTESRAAWTQTDSEKTALQDRRKEAEEALREARLSLTESTDKIASITSQLEELQAQRVKDEAALAALKARSDALTEAMEAVKAAPDPQARASAREALESLLTGGDTPNVGAE